MKYNPDFISPNPMYHPKKSGEKEILERVLDSSRLQQGGPVGYQVGDFVGPPAPPQLQQGPPQLRQMPPQGQQGQQGPPQGQQMPPQARAFKDSMGVWNEAFMKNQQSKQNNLKGVALDTLNEIKLKRMLDTLEIQDSWIRSRDERHPADTLYGPENRNWVYPKMGKQMLQPPGSI